jgi:hypothetical protein
MTDITNWQYYYNVEGTQKEQVRANLVYTPLISPDGTTFCMSFNRDIGYHTDPAENALWSEADLTDRFNKELIFHEQAKQAGIPVLTIKEVDTAHRRVFLEWFGGDFYMQAKQTGNSYEQLLPDWQEQMLNRINAIWAAGITKLSLHPNSWVAHNGVLIPFNWFYCFKQGAEETGTIRNPKITVRSMIKQISATRLEKVISLLDSLGMDIDTPYPLPVLQQLGLASFKANYPVDLIDRLISLNKDIYGTGLPTNRD